MIYHPAPGREVSYSGDPHDLLGLQATVDLAVAALQSKRRYLDSIVVTGLSGVIVGVPVSLAIGVPLVIFRKDKDDSHAVMMGHRAINLDYIGERALWLDDFVSTGETRKRIVGLVEEQGAKLVGQYMYRDDELVFGVKWRTLAAAVQL